MQKVSGGLDKLFVTFHENTPITTLVSKLFSNLTLGQFKKYPGGGSYYATRYVLIDKDSKNGGGNTHVIIYCDPKHQEKKLYRNCRNLVQINGLAFSTSALNGLRPDHKAPNLPHLDLVHLCNAILELDGHVTQLDGYLDDLKGQILNIEKLVFELSRPRSYKLHIRSNLIKDIKGKSTLPRIIGTSCYYGPKNATQTYIYEKHLDPHQGIHTEDNPMKHKHIRFELRLRKAQARKHGQQIIEQIANLGYDFDTENPPQSLTEIITRSIHQHFSYLEKPTHTNKHRAALEAGWKLFIEEGLAAPVITYVKSTQTTL